MNTVKMKSPDGETLDVEAPSQELIQLMVAGWVAAPKESKEEQDEPST